jgi:HTH-type transcriptional regulator/antitoxin HigA
MATEKRWIYSDLAIPPGEFLEEVLCARGISQAELARRIGRPVQAVNEIVQGEKALTPETALQLERALDVSAHIWVGLESRYRLVKARSDEKKLLQKEISNLSDRLYRQLADMGCVTPAREREHKIKELYRFYGVSSLANLPKTKAFEKAFLYRNAKTYSSYALAAWLKCGELRAREVRTEPFDKARLRAALDEIKRSTGKILEETDIARTVGIMARCGVALVTLRGLREARADSAVLWLQAGKPVILMNLETIEKKLFRYLLFHNIAHLLLHKRETFIEPDARSPRHDRLEKEADKFAAGMTQS